VHTTCGQKTKRRMRLLGVALRIQQRPECGLGGSVWDCGLVMAKYLENISDDWIRGKKVIELGSGTGTCGIICALRGATSTVLTDVANQLHLIRENISLNPAAQHITVHEYQWESDCKSLDPPFDLIICSDLVYQPETFEPLLRSWKMLSHPCTRVLLAYEKRKPDVEAKFFGMAAEQQLSCSRVDSSMLDETFQTPDILVFNVTRKLSE